MVFHAWIQSKFPNLQTGQGYRETSPCTDEYNCIAFAAGDKENWWWPDPDGYWPDGVPREETLEAFIAAYRTRGFEPCGDGELEAGVEKIVIYVDSLGTPTHAALQLESGIWKSKLGEGWDIEHDTIHGVEDGSYGKAHQFMKRPLANE